MSIPVLTLKRLKSIIGDAGASFVTNSLDGLLRLLPHTSLSNWKEVPLSDAGVTWESSERRALRLTVALAGQVCLQASLERSKAAVGVGSVARTLDNREHDIAGRAMRRVSGTIHPHSDAVSESSLLAIESMFDEAVVADHIRHHLGLNLDVGAVFRAMRSLATQSYENKSLSFGCVLDPTKEHKPDDGQVFPETVLAWKKHRALTDGFRTAYRVSTNGCIVGFEDLRDRNAEPATSLFFPEWCEHLAMASRGGACSVCLTRQGDILVFDNGQLRFSHRYGNWQYWNHSHIVDLLKSRARVQKVPVAEVGRVVKAIYRAALDVSFRRSGGLFVLLRKKASLGQVVPDGDAIGDKKRASSDALLDEAIGVPTVKSLPRCVIVELAGLDGAVVLSNTGQVLAYGSVLRPKRAGRSRGAEGSRTKAAIGASNYGIAIKVSSDGDMTFYENGKVFLKA